MYKPLNAEAVLDSYVSKGKTILPTDPDELRTYLLELIEYTQLLTLEHRRLQNHKK
jgi:hypothetical protein